MRRILSNTICLAVLLSLCSWKNGEKSEITVDLQKKGPSIAPTMYGAFFEEINHAGDGGLYPELVQNRSFEDNEIPEGFELKGDLLMPPPVIYHLTGKVKQIADWKLKYSIKPIHGWTLQCKDSLVAGMKLTKDRPRFQTAPTNLEIAINNASQKVALVNNGFWGMGVEAGGKYKLRIIVRVSADYKGTIQARLVSGKGKVLASSPVKVSNANEWNDIRETLVSNEKDPKAHLELVFDAPGKVWLDYVSLFPQATFNNRENGMRKDLAQLVADFKPSFMRWPGGSIVGGITLSTRFNWKETLGDPATRPGQYFTWGYRCSYGMGYYEMMQFCEDIGTDVMFVCSAGIGCQHRRGDVCPESEIQSYIDDCSDAIEYALGDPAKSKWGARRAADGHPTPFPLKYVEIGNEHWGPEYERRYSIFYNALKKRYPQLRYIYNGSTVDKDSVIKFKTDIVDPHFYGSPTTFYKYNTLFDNYPRGKFDVYVGEYGCNSTVGSGNMSAALAEAAFINGMERNGDVVTMTSYAPLFENENDRTWSVNLIRFNSEKAIGRSSYYVQKLASLNRPTFNVWNSLDHARTKTPALQYLSSGYDKATGELVLKFVNNSDVPYPATIQLKGVNNVQKRGKAITLSATNPKDENSFDEPKKIYPAESGFDGFGKSFEYEFRPYSYTILRIKTKMK